MWVEMILLIMQDFIEMSLILDLLLLPLWIYMFVSSGTVTCVTILLLPQIMPCVVLVALATLVLPQRFGGVGELAQD